MVYTNCPMNTFRLYCFDQTIFWPVLIYDQLSLSVQRIILSQKLLLWEIFVDFMKIKRLALVQILKSIMKIFDIRQVRQLFMRVTQFFIFYRLLDLGNPTFFITNLSITFFWFHQRNSIGCAYFRMVLYTYAWFGRYTFPKDQVLFLLFKLSFLLLKFRVHFFHESKHFLILKLLILCNLYFSLFEFLFYICLSLLSINVDCLRPIINCHFSRAYLLWKILNILRNIFFFGCLFLTKHLPIFLLYCLILFCLCHSLRLLIMIGFLKFNLLSLARQYCRLPSLQKLLFFLQLLSVSVL